MWWLALLLGPVSWAGPDDAAKPHYTARDLQSIHDLIDNQIAAFRRGDAAGAWQYVAPGLQEKFGSAEHFLEMVKTGYRPVYAPQSYRFGELISTPEGFAQWLDVTGPDGEQVGAIYLFERQPDGSWRTSGCLLTEPRLGRPDT